MHICDMHARTPCGVEIPRPVSGRTAGAHTHICLHATRAHRCDTAPGAATTAHVFTDNLYPVYLNELNTNGHHIFRRCAGARPANAAAAAAAAMRAP